MNDHFSRLQSPSNLIYDTELIFHNITNIYVATTHQNASVYLSYAVETMQVLCWPMLVHSHSYQYVTTAKR